MQNPHLLRAHTRPIIDFIFPFSTFRYKLRGTLLLSVLILGATHAAHAQQTDSYRLDIGDVLELAVVSLPDLNKRLTVDLDGYIEIPGYGSLKVAGDPINQIQNRVKEALLSGLYQQRLPDGRSVQVTILRPDITVRVAEYRPIYVIGDVAKAGEQPYRQGMTVLQAIAVVGGYDIQRFRTQNPILEAADLQGEMDVQQSDLAKDTILIQRLDAELSGSRNFVPKPVDVGVAPDLLQQIMQVETQRFTEGRADLQREIMHLQQLAEQANGKLKILNEQLRQEQKGAQADAEDAERLRSLVQRGVSSTERQEAGRRFSLLSSAKVLQTNVELEQTRKEKAEYERKIEQVTAKYRMELLKELGEATLRLATAKARLTSATEKVLYTNILKSQLVSRSRERPDISIVRQTQNGSMRIPADEGTRLQPGDVIEVTLMVTRGKIDRNSSPRTSYKDRSQSEQPTP